MCRCIWEQRIGVFFRDPKIGFPKFKSKHKSRSSYTTNVVNGNITVKDGRIKLPKISPIKMKQHREVPSEYKLKSVTVSKEPSGKYYASLLYEYTVCENQTEWKGNAEELQILGMDYAMEGMAVLSDGTINSPNVKEEVKTIRSKREELHFVTKRFATNERTSNTN